MELTDRNIQLINQPKLEIDFKGRTLKKYYRPDLYVFNGIVVELKALESLSSDHQSQLLNYLKATDKPVGYLINFGIAKNMELQRMFNPNLLKISSNQ